MTETNGKKYRLGLDLGTNSIGWAAISLDESGESCGILDIGVRIFPDGRDERGEASNAAARRTARGSRRRRDRYLKRRSELMDALVEFGLMPRDESERKSLVQLDPYSLRARALDEPIEPFELGRALFHLGQRRGFKSNRKTGGDNEADGKKLSASIGELQRKIEDSGAGTLGEFLAQRHEKRETVRARDGLDLYPDRTMYQQEFNTIRAKQEQRQALGSGQWDKLWDTIFFQRPLKPVEAGWCQFEFENGERRAARALPVFQEFRMLQEVNNLRVRVGSEPERPLDEQERKNALARLRSGKDIALNKPTRDLRLGSGVAFNLARGGREKVKGDETTARLSKKEMFGKHWQEFSLEERNVIVKFLLETEDPEAIRKKAEQEWGLNTAQAETVAGVSLVAGYGNLSEKAINKMLPHLESGMGYDEAVKSAGYEHHSDFRNNEAHGSLPYYGEVLPRDAVGADLKKDPVMDGDSARYGRFPNPTVHIGLNQLRRVANKLIEVYGKPEDIVVELTRDLKMNRKQKLDLERQQRNGREANKRFRNDLESAEMEATGETLRKLRLWEEQKNATGVSVCPYTGRTLSFETVVSAQTEVDHILPFSKTLDDSMSNKVVCIAAANRYKGDRSPYEAFGHSPQDYDYDNILARTANFPPNKCWRFQPDAMEQFDEEAGFLDRQLNETSYLSRTAKNYLAYLYDEKGEGRVRVRAAPGRMTALLRHRWELEGMLRVSNEGEIRRKQRDDHRHHAVDAFVVACTTPGLLKKFADASSSSNETEERLAAVAKETLPWEGFHRNQIKSSLENLIVSYKPDHGKPRVKGQTTGQLHNETAYGLVKLSETGPSEVVVRKKVADFKKRDELKAVRDEAMREALKELWDEVTGEDGKPAGFAERAVNPGVLLEGRRQPVRRVRVLDKQTVVPVNDRAGNPYKGYKLDSNAFADVWEMPDKRKSWKIVAVPVFYANRPDFDFNKFRPHPSAKRLMRLHKNDMGALEEGKNRRVVRIRKFGDGYVVLDDHNEADVDGRERKGEIKRNNGHSATRLRTERFRKVNVNEMGRVHDPGPRKP